MKYEKPDGVIEFEISGCCCPPGQRRPGMHTNACTSWWRVNEEPWVSYWDGSHTRTLAGAAETCVEFVEEMEKQRWLAAKIESKEWREQVEEACRKLGEASRNGTVPDVP